MKTGLVKWVVAIALLAGTVSVRAESEFQMPRTEEGWTDLAALLVLSDGSRSLGDTKAGFNDTRDQGSKIVFFDPEQGDNEAAEVYWWDGKRIVDSSGSPTGADGKAYGTNPLLPNENTIKAFRNQANVKSDVRLKTHKRGGVATGYPDWFLLRRGRLHDTFGSSVWGGRSQPEPMVIAAYGPVTDGRAVVDADGANPFGGHAGGNTEVQLHQVIAGLELHQGFGRLGTHANCTSPGAPGVPTCLIEDCKLLRAPVVYAPIGTTVRRSVIAFNWNQRSHNQGYFTNKYGAATTLEEVILYKNGFKNDPRTHADPRRTIFDRNIYQGGGAQMGHTYRNIISATGGSGGPQMRLGGRCENSLIIEGYWYSSTASNKLVNPWLVEGAQRGQSAVVRNNVQLVYAFPTPNDPDTAERRSDGRAQPGNGYTLQGASFGCLIEGNIVSQAALIEDLGFEEGKRGRGFALSTSPLEFQDGQIYSQQNNTVRGNIGYRTEVGLSVKGNWTEVEGNVVEDNVFVADQAIVHESVESLSSPEQLKVHDNRFYANSASLPDGKWIGSANTLAPYAEAAKSENWPDPDRTLKRYVTEVLGLTLLDWQDDPWLPEGEVAPRAKAGESYDPMGLKTFMAVATNMRKAGTDPIPASGKPSWSSDYPWDARFTGVAVVNWIRAGFGLPPVPN